MSSAWVICFVAIRFDLDIGPVVEYVVPPDALNDENKKRVTQSAFPDCNPESGHDLIFFFRIKDCTTLSDRMQEESIAIPLTPRTTQQIYGATYYRQKRDMAVPRGCVQQAVVMLSRLPYISVHELILRVVMPRFCQCCALSPDTEKVPVLSPLSPEPTALFEIDSSFNPSLYSQADVLSRAVEEIDGWPTPHPHVEYSLTLLHQPITFVTPTRCLVMPSNSVLSGCVRSGSGGIGISNGDSGGNGSGSGSGSGSGGGAAAERLVEMRVDERVRFLGQRHRSFSAHSVIPLYSLLTEHLRHLMHVWELLLCHEPIFVWSSTPSMASATAFALASLVEPLEFRGTLRSYFTVQDEEFARFSRLGKAMPFPPAWGGVVASTNPFFFRAFEGWPNAFTIMDRHARSGSGGGSGAAVQDANENAPSGVSASRNPPLFTYTHLVPALEAAKRGSENKSSGVSVSLTETRTEVPRQAKNAFHSSFNFLVDNGEQTAALLRRLEQASRLNEETQLASLGAWSGAAREQTTTQCSGGENKSGLNGDSQQSQQQQQQQQQQQHLRNTVEANGFSQYSIADDIVRKFFITLTKEFLMPVSAWFQGMTSSLTVFHLCDIATLTALTPDSFLEFLREHRETVPPFLSRHPYKTYRTMYERFARGCLFQSAVWQLMDRKVRQGLEELQVDAWAAQYPSEAERIDMFISLYGLVQREVTQSIDPDIVFITISTSVLVGMAVHMNEPLRDQLLLKIRELKL